MKYLNIVFLAFVFVGCLEKEPTPEPQIIKEVVIKEPSIVNNEKTVYIELEKQVCPMVHPCAPCPKYKPKPCNPITIYKEYKKAIFGELEKVYFPIHSFLADARIDTGAQTSSMHAENIVGFERDGKDWVRFDVLNSKQEKIQIKRPIVKTIKVKRHGEEAQDRYVVNMRMNIGEVSSFTEMSLADRTQYKYPVLVGRNYLQGNAVVDVSLQYTHEPRRDNK